MVLLLVKAANEGYKHLLAFHSVSYCCECIISGAAVNP
jgi:hypothetical protein